MRHTIAELHDEVRSSGYALIAAIASRFPRLAVVAMVVLHRDEKPCAPCVECGHPTRFEDEDDVGAPWCGRHPSGVEVD